MRVALFGGSFNPPHVAHQLVALYVLETAPVDELWFVPAFQHPFDKPLESFVDRFRMCELAALALGARACVSDIEARLGGPSRTLSTVRKLMDEHPGYQFSLVIGSDLLGEIETWYRGTELRRLIPFIVVGRGNPAPVSAPVAALVLAPPPAMPAVSSTQIRALLAAGGNAAPLVPKSVLDYITSRGLYRSRETL
jgi:nicotinate-nucleotide adenylyltransferase